jgi:hypothetical protein
MNATEPSRRAGDLPIDTVVLLPSTASVVGREDGWTVLTAGWFTVRVQDAVMVTPLDAAREGEKP